MDWFLYDNGLPHERVKNCSRKYLHLKRKKTTLQCRYKFQTKLIVLETSFVFYKIFVFELDQKR